MAPNKPRGPTAYFIFSEEQRQGVQQELLKQQPEGAKVSVAIVAKAIGEKWRALTDEQKTHYKELAQQRAQQAAATGNSTHTQQAASICLLHFGMLHRLN